MKRPLIVGIGRTPNPNSSTEQVLEIALHAAEQALCGRPTPLGAAINTPRSIFYEGLCSDVNATRQLTLVGRQPAKFAALALRNPAIGVTA